MCCEALTTAEPLWLASRWFSSSSLCLSVCLSHLLPCTHSTHTQCSVCHYTRTHCHWGLTLGSYLSSQDCCTAVCERKPSLSNVLQHVLRPSECVLILCLSTQGSTVQVCSLWMTSWRRRLCYYGYHGLDLGSILQMQLVMFPSLILSVRKRLLHSHGLTITKGSLSFDKCNQKMGLQLLTLSCSSPKFSKQQRHITLLFCSSLISLLYVVVCPRSSFLFSAAFSFLCCIAGNPRPKGRGLPLMWQRLQK